MNLSCSSRAIKYLMFAFNVLFVITGIVLITVGASVKVKYNVYDTFLDDKYFSLPNLLIATGILIFIISFLGCYGAIKESWIMLMAFSVLLGVIFIFEFSAGIAGYALRDKTSRYLEDKFYETLPSYNTSVVIAGMWDIIQQEFKCCGVFGPNDWVKELKQNYDLPISCCPMVNGGIGEFRCNNYVTTTTVSTTSASSPATEASTPNITPTGSPSSETPSSKPPSPETPSPETSPSSTSPLTTLPHSGVPKLSRQRRASENNTSVSPESTSTPYSTGCEAAFGNFVKSHAVDIGAVCFALAVMQIIGIGFACHLSRQLKNRYYST